MIVSGRWCRIRTALIHLVTLWNACAHLSCVGHHRSCYVEITDCMWLLMPWKNADHNATENSNSDDRRDCGRHPRFRS
jgi:hypothetical protein